MITPIEAMLKEEPMKVKDIKVSFYPRSTLIQNIYGRCPQCNSMQQEDNYCANCGQRLDFSIERKKGYV